MEIKGTTLVNIYGKGFSDVANIGNGSGEIVDDGYYKLVANGSFRNAFLQKGKFPMKPSTVYTVIMFVRKETLVGSKLFMLSDGTSDSPFQDSSIDLNGIGTYTKKVTTLSDFDSTAFCFRGYIFPQATSGELEFKVMLLEGDWTNKPIPQYFEGMKSVGQDDVNGHKIEISSQNKNLLLPTARDKEIPIFLKKGTTLTLSTKDNAISNGGNIMMYDVNGEVVWFSIDTGQTSVTRTLPRDIYYMKDVLSYDVNYELKYQLEISNTKTSYVEPKQNKKEILLNEPLRGLPNGIRDTIEKVNGEWKIVRRFGEYFLNGDESWQYRNQGDNTTTYSFTFNSAISSKNPLTTNDGIIISDCVIGIDNNSTNGVEGISIKKQGGNSTTTNEIYIEINRSRLSTLDTVGLKEWLTKNPIKLIYELATPIIEDISPITLLCWKNGTISIDEILPVETTHTVALNKPAQIKRNIEELTALRKRVQALEDFYDKVALEQSHQLSLLNNSIELDYDI